MYEFRELFSEFFFLVPIYVLTGTVIKNRITRNMNDMRSENFRFVTYHGLYRRYAVNRITPCSLKNMIVNKKQTSMKTLYDFVSTISKEDQLE